MHLTIRPCHFQQKIALRTTVLATIAFNNGGGWWHVQHHFIQGRGERSFAWLLVISIINILFLTSDVSSTAAMVIVSRFASLYWIWIWVIRESNWGLPTSTRAGPACTFSWTSASISIRLWSQDSVFAVISGRNWGFVHPLHNLNMGGDVFPVSCWSLMGTGSWSMTVGSFTGVGNFSALFFIIIFLSSSFFTVAWATVSCH